jgi:hypothetical protein
MKGTVIKEFDGAKDGTIYPVKWKSGDVVEGDLARVAIENKWAEEGTAEIEKNNNLPDGVPKDWEKLNAPNLLALARKHGAGDEITKKAEAVEFIEALIVKHTEA